MATAKKTPASASAKASKPGTAVAPRANSAVVSVKETMAAQLAKLADKTAPATGNKIRVTQDKQFELPDGTKTREPLQLVIVEFASRNTYYLNPFDKDNPEPPACYAIGDNPRTLVPADASPEKQSDACSSCPMNAFQSAPNGKGKACKNGRLLAVLPPDADADTPMWTLEVSPTALKGFDAYVNNVARTFQTSPAGVITTVGLSDAVEYPSLTFGEPVVNENVAMHLSRLAEAAEMVFAEPDVSQFGVEKPAAKAPARKVAPARKTPATARR